jgi:tryptophan-rich sensory protein
MLRLNYFIIPLVAFAVAYFGGRVTSTGMDWYRTINLPAWTPSGAVIGAVWTTIFILTAMSAILVWNKGMNAKYFPAIVGIFILNAVLNFTWSYLFFGKHLIGTDVFVAGLLEISVLFLIILIWPISKLASSLLFPYSAWVFFATYLNYLIWSLNK